MPKMSGYDMVKEIRSLSEQSEHIDVQPYIVAVTANALKGEQERCLNAGMNDYVTKPLELNILESALQKWSQSAHKAYYTVHKKNTAADEKKDSLAEPIQVNILPDQEQKHPVNINTINKYINHDTAKKTRFFKMYIEQSKNLLRDINGGVIAMDENVIMGACHQLKSISNTIGAEKVAQLATEFEAYCQNGSLSSDELIRLRNRLDDHYACAEQFIYDHLGN